MILLLLLGLVAVALGLVTGGVRLWRWNRGRAAVYRLLSGALLLGGLYLALMAVGLFWNPH